MANDKSRNTATDAWLAALAGNGVDDEQFDHIKARALRKLILRQQAAVESDTNSASLAAGRRRLQLEARRRSRKPKKEKTRARSIRHPLTLAATIVLGIAGIFASLVVVQTHDGPQVLRSAGQLERLRGVTQVYRVSNDNPLNVGQELADAFDATSVSYQLVRREDGVLALSFRLTADTSLDAVNAALAPTGIVLTHPGFYQFEMRRLE